MTPHLSKVLRRSLCARHHALGKVRRHRRQLFSLSLGLALAGFAAVGGAPSARANTPLNVPNGTTDLTTLGATAASDLTFTSGTAYAPTAFTLTGASALNIGTLNDLDATQTLTISDASGAAATITLNGGANSVAPDAGDLLYVATGGTLTLNAGTGVTALGLALGANGNFDVAGTANIGSIISGTGFGFEKTGVGTLNLTGQNTFTGGVTIGAGLMTVGVQASSTQTTAFGTGTLTLGDAAIGSNAALTLFGFAGQSNPITIAAGTGTRTITSASNNAGQAPSFSGAVTLNNTLTLGATSLGTLRMNGNISDPNATGSGLIVNASGTAFVRLAGTSTFTGGVAVQLGTLELTATTGAGTGTVTLGSGTNAATFLLSNTSLGTVANPIKGAAGATGVLTVSSSTSTNSATESGGINLNGDNIAVTNNSTASGTTAAGNLTLSTNAITGTGNLVVTDASTGTASTANAGNVTLSGGITNTGNVTLNNNSSSVGGAVGTITVSTNSINNTGTITNSGTGIGVSTVISAVVGANVQGITQNTTSATAGLTLSGANTTYTGGVTVSNGYLQLTNSNGAGTGAISLGSGTTYLLLATTGGGTYPNNISGSGAVQNFDGSAVNETLTGALSYTGNTYFRTAASTITFNPSANSTLTGVVGSTTGGFGTPVAGGNVAKAGANTLTLSGNNLYTGTTAVNAGTLVLSGNNAASATTVAAGATLQLKGNANALTGTLLMNGVTTPSVLQLRADTATTFNTGAITLQSDPTTGADTTSYTIDLGAATVSGVPTTLTLGGAFGFSAATGNRGADVATVNITGPAGYTLALGAVGDSPNGNAVTENFNVANGLALTIASFTQAASAVNHVLEFSGAGNVSVAGNITRANTTRLTNTLFASTGTVTLNGTMDSGTAARTSTLNSGTVLINNAAALGSTTDTLNSIVFTGGTLQYGTGITTDYSPRINSSTNAISVDTNGNNVTYATALPATNTGGLTKSGAGTLTLSANNLYSGTTLVANGKLNLTNPGSSATGAGAVNVGSLTQGTPTNSTISGTGTSTGLLTVIGGARIAPGVNTADVDGSGRTNFGSASTVTLGSVGGMTLTNANMDFDLASTAAGTSDRIATGGTLTLGTLNFNLNQLGGSLEQGTQYVLISGATLVSGNTTGITTTYLNGSSYTAVYTVVPDTVALGTFNLDVTFAAVPEPGTWALVAGGFGLAAFARRRRRAA